MRNDVENVLSLFDGHSGGQIALNRSGIKYSTYLASEIDKHCVVVTQRNYPNTIQLGDVTKIDMQSLPKIDLLIGGSPCQGFSFSGKGLNFEDPRSKLFFKYVEIKNHTNPKYFLLENVKMLKWQEDVISEHLGVSPVMIDSSIFSAQKRKRLYWTNIPIDNLPQDKGILIRDILDSPIQEYNKTLFYGKEDFILKELSSKNNRVKGVSITDRGIRPHKGDSRKSGISELGTLHFLDTKSYTIIASHVPKILTGLVDWRKLSVTEAERLQTVPVGYTDGVSDNQRYKMLGNGWTVDVVSHIFKNLKNDLEKS